MVAMLQHNISGWIVAVTITSCLLEHMWLITSVRAGQSTPGFPVSTTTTEDYCEDVEVDCDNINATTTTTNSSSSSSYTLERSSWCPPGYHLVEDVMLCSQKSCLTVSPQTVEMLRETGMSTENMSNETSGTENRLICIPVTPEYKTCRKLPLTSRQYEILESNASIHVLDSNTTVSIGQFVMLQNGIASVCNTNETSNRTSKDFEEEEEEEDGWLTEESLNNMSLSCMPFKVPSDQFEMLPNGSAHAFNYSIAFSSHFYDANSSVSNNSTSVCYEMTADFLDCSSTYQLALREEFLLLPNMSLREAYRKKRTLPLGSYLFTKQEEFVVHCIPVVVPKHGYSTTQRYLYGTGCTISTVFLLVALSAHLLFPNLNYHAKALLCHIISMVFMYFMLSLQFASELTEWQAPQCYVYFAVSYVAILGSFFWPNILAFDLWRVFANLRGRSATSQHKRRKFLYQCAYSWGIPIVLCIILMIIDNNVRLQRKLNMPLNLTKTCWFSTRKTQIIFFHVPIVLILLLNALYFILTVYNIRNASKGTDVLNKKASQQLVRVFAKLFIVTGLFWFAEVMAWFVKLDEKWFYVTDFANSLQGVAIFFVYICNRRTVRLIRKRLGHEETSRSQVTQSVSSSLQGNSVKSIDSVVATTQLDTAVTSEPSEQLAMRTISTEDDLCPRMGAS